MTGVPERELAAVLALLHKRRPALIAVGHGRGPAHAARAAALVDAWPGEVVAVVSWPERAASWLRQARRFAAAGPDVWVVADDAAGWQGFGPRVAATGGWYAERTIAFSGLCDPSLPAVAGRVATDGLSGATENGAPWTFLDGELRIGTVAWN